MFFRYRLKTLVSISIKLLFDIELYIADNVTACMMKLILAYMWNVLGYSFKKLSMTLGHSTSLGAHRVTLSRLGASSSKSKERELMA